MTSRAAVSRSHAPFAASVSFKESRFLRESDLLTRFECCLVHDERNDSVFEIGRLREAEVEVPETEGLDDPRIADIVAWQDILDRLTKGEVPGKQEGARQDVGNSESVSLQECVAQSKLRIAVCDSCACRHLSSGDRNIVARYGESCDLVKGKNLIHDKMAPIG